MCQYQLTIQMSIFPNAPYFVPFALSNTRQLYLSRDEFLLSLDVLTRDTKIVIVAFILRNMYPAIMAITKGLVCMLLHLRTILILVLADTVRTIHFHH